LILGDRRRFASVRGLPVLIEGWKYLARHGSAAAQNGNGRGTA